LFCTPSTTIKKCITQYQALYGDHLISYNVHSLLHLSMFVKINGWLDNFSCFKYENYVQEVKFSIKSSKYCLQEVYNRISKKQKLFLRDPLELQYSLLRGKEIENHTSSIHFNLTDKLYKAIVLNDLGIHTNIIKDSD